jgi:sterol desaturase/sphingolipid hydroxylase (fatty acid hydroxylase superfamily)
MDRLIIYAIPGFVLLLVVELLSFRLAQDDDELVGYEFRDTRTSLSMGGGNVLINAGWTLAVAVVYQALYELSPWSIPSDVVWAWVLLFFLDDFAYYWFHRVSHEVRLFWGSHVVHHSSQHFNLSTALRQTWVPMTYFPFWVPLALMGYRPWMIFTQQSISLIYQFWIHTEKIGKLPRPIEFIFNTPSHHRVHHGSQHQYLDRNYAGILIIWDRMFGTFEPEGERVRYGLTKNLTTFNPVKVAFHEYRSIREDVRNAKSWRERFGYVFGGPGWTPDHLGDRRELERDVPDEPPPAHRPAPAADSQLAEPAKLSAS